jgi:RimJ/RimL family protein N-acetyltransferase
MAIALRTTRLLLREWRDEDSTPFAAMSADTEVMELLLGPQDRARSDAWVGWARGFWRDHGYGQWVVELPGEAPFAGVVGLNRLAYAAHFTPAVEIAWRLARPYWGRGIAYEVAITTPANRRSWRLMERLGMARDVDGDFDHPLVPDGHRLKRHVLYRIRRR